MTATAIELARAAEVTSPTKMARTAKPCAAEVAASADMCATEARSAAVESTATAKMTATEMRATTHVNAAAMSTAATRTRIGSNGENCQKCRRYDRDFEKLSHGLRLASENNVQTLNVRCVKSFRRNRVLLSRPCSFPAHHALASQRTISQS